MGKTKQKKHKAPKPLPTGLPSIRDVERQEAANGEVEVPGGAAHTVANVVDKVNRTTTQTCLLAERLSSLINYCLKMIQVVQWTAIIFRGLYKGPSLYGIFNFVLQI